MAIAGAHEVEGKPESSWQMRNVSKCTEFFFSEDEIKRGLTLLRVTPSFTFNGKHAALPSYMYLDLFCNKISFAMNLSGKTDSNTIKKRMLLC